MDQGLTCVTFTGASASALEGAINTWLLANNSGGKEISVRHLAVSGIATALVAVLLYVPESAPLARS